MQLAGLGTTVVFALAALVWIAYLVPVWTRRREFLATERNAVRLQQTLRIMAETAEAPPEVQLAADAREIARQQRVVAKEARLQQAMRRAEAVARARELDDEIRRVERQVRQAVAGSASRRQRLRRTRLACTLMLVVSLGVVAAAILLPQLASALAIVAGGVAVLAVVGLVAVDRAARSARTVAREARAEVEVDVPVVARRPVVRPDVVEHAASRTWTPVPVPPQRTQRPPIEVLRDHARRLAETGELAPVTSLPATFEQLVTGEQPDTAARATTDGARVAVTTAPGAATSVEAAPAVVRAPAERASRFAAMGVLDEVDGAFDAAAAFRRRVG